MAAVLVTCTAVFGCEAVALCSSHLSVTALIWSQLGARSYSTVHQPRLAASACACSVVVQHLCTGEVGESSGI
jgi:hypothetical protein